MGTAMYRGWKLPLSLQRKGNIHQFVVRILKEIKPNARCGAGSSINQTRNSCQSDGRAVLSNTHHRRVKNAQTHFCYFCLPCVLGCYREASSRVTRPSMSEEDGLCTEMWRVLFRLRGYINLSWEKRKCEHRQHTPSNKTRLRGGDSWIFQGSHRVIISRSIRIC